MKSKSSHNPRDYHHPWLKLILLSTIPILLMVLIFIYAGQAVDRDAYQFRDNLSRSAAMKLGSGIPQIASHGTQAALVWSEGYTNVSGIQTLGHIYLQTTDDTGDYWRGKTTVYTATDTRWGTDPVLVFDQTNNDLIHIVWALGMNCGPDTTCDTYPEIQYSQCHIGSDLNTCTTPQRIISSNNAINRSLNMIQDSDNDLHLVWTNQDSNQVLYSRRDDTNQTWSSETSVGVASEGKTPQLAYSVPSNASGRLHLLWYQAGKIQYTYDNTHDNNSFTSSRPIFDLPLSAEAKDSGNPSIIAEGDGVFVVFNILRGAQNQDQTTFNLLYNASPDGGDNWSTSSFDIPTGKINSDQFTDYIASDRKSDFTDGLQAQLTFTQTNQPIWLHVVWQAFDDETESSYQIYYARLDNPFSELPIWTVNYPLTLPKRVLPTPSATIPPLRSSKLSQPTQGQSEDGINSVAPSLTIDASGQPHAVYLDQLLDPIDPTSDPIPDVFYSGGVARTIDPDYIRDEVSLSLKTNPEGTILSTDLPIPVRPITYTLEISNKGNLDAVFIGLTNTLPSGVTFMPASLQDTSGESTFVTDQNIVSWVGTVLAQTSITVSFIVNTPEVIETSSFTNTVGLWNRSSILAKQGFLKTQESVTTVSRETPLTYIQNQVRFDLQASPRGEVVSILPVPTLLLNYTLYITNQGDLAVVNVGITNTLPSGVSNCTIIDAPPNVPNDASKDQYVCNTARGQLTWSAGIIDPFTTKSIQFVVEAPELNDAAALPQTFENKADFWHNSHNVHRIIETKTAPVTIEQKVVSEPNIGPDEDEQQLALTLQTWPAGTISKTLPITATLLYTLSIANMGDKGLNRIGITNTLPKGTMIVSGSLKSSSGAVPSYRADIRQISWSGTASAQEMVIITYQLRLVTITQVIDLPKTVTNQAELWSNNTGVHKSLQTAQVSTRIEKGRLGPIILTMNVEPRQVIQTPPISTKLLPYTYKMENTEPTRHRVHLTATLPSDVTYVGLISNSHSAFLDEITADYIAWQGDVLGDASGWVTLTVRTQSITDINILPKAYVGIAQVWGEGIIDASSVSAYFALYGLYLPLVFK